MLVAGGYLEWCYVRGSIRQMKSADRSIVTSGRTACRSALQFIRDVGCYVAYLFRRKNCAKRMGNPEGVFYLRLARASRHAENEKTIRTHLNSKKKLVEPMRIELTTFALRTRRSPN